MKVFQALKRGHGLLLIFLFIISLFIGSISCITIEAPVILNGTEISHLEGETLTLLCEGEENLKWNHSRFDIMRNKRVNAVSSINQFGARKKYSSTLTFKNMLLGESGFLFCEYDKPSLSSYKDFISVRVIKDSDARRRPHKRGFRRLIIIIAVIFSLLGAIVILAVLLYRYKSNLRELRDKLRDKPETESEEELRRLKTNDTETKNKYNQRTEEEPDFDEPDSLPLDTAWEFPRNRLKLGTQIGSGAFGRVLKAEAKGILLDDPTAVTTIVAVKTVKANADESHVKALMRELKVMANLGRHINVLNLLGACTKNCTLNTELYVIVEFCTRGSLLHFIRRNNKHFVNQLVDAGSSEIVDTTIYGEISFLNNQRTLLIRRKPTWGSDNINHVFTLGEISTLDNFAEGERNFPSNPLSSATSITSFRFEFEQDGYQAITTTDLLCWAFQIARGMEYLASRKVIHGDLAARNVLLTDNNVVKICDFGLAKELYKDYYYKMSTKTKEGKFPLKWMALESILYGELSTESDCWSFGVVLWELFSLGKLPYTGIKADDDLIKRIENGYRMEKPEYALCSIHSIMNECWASEKRDRPTFPALVDAIGAIIERNLRDHYIQLNRDYVKGNRLSTNSNDKNTDAINSQTDEPQFDSIGYLKPNSRNSSMSQQRPSPVKWRERDMTAESTIITVST